MAITHDYVDYGAGNDYKGASFTDGAYTSATKTLVKNGAFAATKVNHWLYLESNDGGSIVAGYYKVATVPDANTVTLATDAGAGVDDDAAKCTQHDGSDSLPWRSLQGAFDLCTRNTTDGNQVNLKAGTAHVNAAALDLTTFIAGGALAVAAPLILRGYTSAANDGGIGEIDCGGATMFAATTYDYIYMADLEIHSGGDNILVDLDQGAILYRCELHKGASSPSGKMLLDLGSRGQVIACYFHDPGSGASEAINNLTYTGIAYGNYIVMGADSTGIAIDMAAYGVAIGNIILLGNAGQIGIDQSTNCTIMSNIVYNTAAGTAQGINGSIDVPWVMINNIICGFSGANGEGINGVNSGVLGYNAFWNNTANYTVRDQTFIDLTANDVTLAADPFTDAANGDFSLTAAAKTALAAKGWPTSYLGAHANTVPNLNIGPIQMAAGGAAGGGFPILGGSVVR